MTPFPLPPNAPRTALPSAEVQLTPEEQAFDEYLETIMTLPQGSIFDTAYKRLERYEPLARSIESILESKEFEPYITNDTRVKALQ